MITKDIARLIYNCYTEIENSENMILEMKSKIDENGNLLLKDNWGNEKSLELHIPNGDSSRSVRRIPMRMAFEFLKEHIVNQNIELNRLRDVCRVMLHEPETSK